MSDLARFEALLREAAHLQGEIRLVPMVNQYYGHVEFYAHIIDRDSQTVDVALCNGPKLGFLDLQRGASGLRGAPAKEVSAKLEVTQQPLPDST